MPKYVFRHLKDFLQNRFYPYTHVNAVYINDDETKTVSDKLQEIDSKIEHSTESVQSDWNEINAELGSFIKNKPDSLPANGGNADTLEGKTANDLTLKSEFNSHITDINAHQDLFGAKLDTEIANNLIKESSFNPISGVLTFTRLNGTTLSFNIPKSLVFKSALFDETANEIVITWSDDSKSRIPVEGLIDIYTGSVNEVIEITVSDDNIISGIIKSGSITRVLFSTDINTDLSKAHQHDNKAVLDGITDTMLSNIETAYNHTANDNIHVVSGGTTGYIYTMTEEGAKWQELQQNTDTVNDYSLLVNKPSINNVELTGNTSFEDLDITALGIGADIAGSADSALIEAKEYIDSSVSSKVDKVVGMGLSQESYTTEEKDKLKGIHEDANNYVHPETHPATIITEDDKHQFITAEEKALIGTNNLDDILFLLKNQEVISFLNNVCTITDSRITANSLADVYFTSDTIATAQKANITVETYVGNVKLTAEKTPTGTVKASITIKVVD